MGSGVQHVNVSLVVVKGEGGGRGDKVTIRQYPSITTFEREESRSGSSRGPSRLLAQRLTAGPNRLTEEWVDNFSLPLWCLVILQGIPSGSI